MGIASSQGNDVSHSRKDLCPRSCQMQLLNGLDLQHIFSDRADMMGKCKQEEKVPQIN